MVNSKDSDKLVHATSHPIVKINSKRFIQSPYAERYVTDQTVFGCYSNRFYAMSNGEDALEQYWKLRRGVMLFDVPEKPIDIQGPDTVTLLDKVFARPMAGLKVGRANYAIACTPQGGIQMDGIMIRLSEDHFWYVFANGDFASWLIAHSGGLDVTISDPQSRVLQIQGPKSLEFLEAATDKPMPKKFNYFDSARFSFAGQSLLVTRTGWTGELGFEIYSDGNTNHLALWDHLINAGKPFGLENAALEVMGMRRLEAGILDYGTDIDSSMTPYDVGLGKFVNFSNPDFVGREALERANKNCRLFGVTSKTGVPRVGFEVLQNDTVVGIVKVGDWSPTLELGIGYVLFDAYPMEPGGWLGASLTLRDKSALPGSEEFACEIVSLPLYDAEKKIPRGL